MHHTDSHVQKKKPLFNLSKFAREHFHGCRIISYLKEQRYHVRRYLCLPKAETKRACREFRTRAKNRDGFRKQEGTDGADSQLLPFNSLQFILTLLWEKPAVKEKFLFNKLGSHRDVTRDDIANFHILRVSISYKYVTLKQ
ncbi:hypothetical protein CEXT_278981 [Caerostris extrusa]|uniref:Uncharacterized protein n=1 Tax=Caerostris extrusa TaxID=172846 RepID=A0AAV4XB26_CAEEX|nr:hypothetical protein CEXT_278981 [Caerostris extrusa]